MELNLLDFGINQDPEFDNASSIQACIDTIYAKGGGKLIVSSGLKLMSGPFELKSNVHLHLESNSEIYANPDVSVYKRSAFKKNEGEGTVWIYGENVNNLIISGTGALNGNDTAFLGKDLGHSYEILPFTKVDKRPHLMLLENCNNLTMENITLKRSCYWCLHLAGCNDVRISGVRILNSLKVRNSDGIDIDHSKEVRISDCYIESGDDCICLKNRREYEEYGDCENIAVTNCTMKSTSCSFKIGSENVNRIRNVVVSNCIITDSNRGIGIQNRDEGTVENVLFNNIIVESRLFHDVWWGKSEPIYITAFPRASGNNVDENWRFAPGQKLGKVGRISNITFSNLQLSGENGIYVSGVVDTIENVSFHHISLNINKTSKYQGGIYDNRPCDTTYKGIYHSENHGIYLENGKNIDVSNITVQWGENVPEYFGYALYANEINGLRINNFSGKHAKTKNGRAEHLLIENCTDVDKYTKNN